jgi:hypothetical protein
MEMGGETTGNPQLKMENVSLNALQLWQILGFWWSHLQSEQNAQALRERIAYVRLLLDSTIETGMWSDLLDLNMQQVLQAFQELRPLNMRDLGRRIWNVYQDMRLRVKNGPEW